MKGPSRSSSQATLAHRSTTHDGGFTLSLLMLNVKQGSCDGIFYRVWFDPTGIEPESTVAVADALST